MKRALFLIPCAVSFALFWVIAGVWMYTSQRNIEWNGIDSRVSRPTYDVHLHPDYWMIARYVPLRQPIPCDSTFHRLARREYFADCFVLWNEPRVAIVHKSPRVMQAICIGYQAKLRVPYWVLFVATAVLPGWYGLGRWRRRVASRSSNALS